MLLSVISFGTQLSIQSILLIKGKSLAEVNICRLHHIGATPQLVCDEVEDEQRRAQIVGKESLGSASLAERGDRQVKLASYNEEDDDDSKVPSQVSMSYISNGSSAY